MDKIRVNITREDINNGERNSNCECPMALALRRKFSTALSLSIFHRNSVRVETRCVFLTDKHEVKHRYSMSDNAIDFVDAFDRGDRVDINSNKRIIKPITVYLTKTEPNTFYLLVDDLLKKN